MGSSYFPKTDRAAGFGPSAARPDSRLAAEKNRAHGNPSSFAVYSSIRQTVLTCLMQRLSATLKRALEGLADTDSDDEDVKTGNELTRIPKVKKTNNFDNLLFVFNFHQCLRLVECFIDFV